MNASSVRLSALSDLAAVPPISIKKSPLWKPVLLAGFVLLGAGALFKMGYEPRAEREDALNVTQIKQISQLRTVTTAHAQPAPTSQLRLPANLHAQQSTDIYARVNGYLKVWHVEIGDRVTAGQMLAEIDAPELDQQLRKAEAVLVQGRAEVDQAKSDVTQAIADWHQAEAEVKRVDASLDFAQRQVKRIKGLEDSGAVSVQMSDEANRNEAMGNAELNAANSRVHSLETAIAGKQSAVQTKEAMVKSLEADVQRLVETESFKSVVAPFAGVITRREAEVGALVNAGNAGKGNQLFSLVNDDSLRIHVNVPQDVTARIKTGQTACVYVKEFPGIAFKAQVRRTASAVDQSTRTLLTELELTNPSHTLLSGTYADAVFEVATNGTTMVIPSNALLVNKAGVQVAVVDTQDTIHLRPVAIGKDFGQNVEVLNGLTQNEELVVNPPDNLKDKEQVEVANRPKATVVAIK